jgi:hypothetical protein
MVEIFVVVIAAGTVVVMVARPREMEAPATLSRRREDGVKNQRMAAEEEEEGIG